MRTSQLSFGLSMTAFQLNIDRQDIYVLDPGDTYLQNYDMNVFIPDANFGVYYMTRNYYVGFSANQLFNSSIKIGKNGNNGYQLNRHYYIIGEYRFDLSYDLSLRPSIVAKTFDNFNTFQTTFTTTLYYKDNYWAGLSYRTNDALSVLFGIKYLNYYFGYSFDYSLNKLQKYTFGSHEFMFAAKFGDNARRYRWLKRY